jgi:flagellar basal body L-ring protein FlgH
MRWTVKRENKKQCSLFNIRRGKRVKDLILLVLNSQVSVHSSCSLASCRTAATIKNKTNYEEYYSVYTIPEAAKCMMIQLAPLEQARSSFYGQEIKS